MSKWFIIFSLVVISSCSSTNPISPEVWMIQLSPHIYVDPEMSPLRQRQLLVDIHRAKGRIAQFFGGNMQSLPVIYACVSRQCEQAFSSIHRSPETELLKQSKRLQLRAKALSASKILLTEAGCNETTITHEMTHIEFHQRLGKGVNLNRVPMWFDEGLAILVCGDSRYTQEKFLFTRNLNKHLRTELQWLSAIKNDTKPYQRSYQAVREWYAQAGTDGLLQTIDQMKQTGRFSLVPSGKSTISKRIAAY